MAVDEVAEVVPVDACSVVVNSVGQYAVWPAKKAVPEGWSEVEVCASEDAALARVEELWGEDGPMNTPNQRR